MFVSKNKALEDSLWHTYSHSICNLFFLIQTYPAW